MKKLLPLCFLLLFSLFSIAGVKDTTVQKERFVTEMAVNISIYNSLSISVEKEFTYGKFTFGPRVELVNLFNTESYKGEDSTFTMNTQFRIRLAQVEYSLNDKIKVGIAPFWMLGPIPRNGFYKTPTSIYTHIQLKEGLSLETSFTTSEREMIQLSVRKEL
jgi:hypothetical protein